MQPSLDCNVSGGTAFSVHQRKREKQLTCLHLVKCRGTVNAQCTTHYKKPKLKEMVKISQCIQFRREHQSGKHLLLRTSVIHTNPQRCVFKVTVVILQCSQTDRQKPSSFQKNKHCLMLFRLLFLSSKHCLWLFSSMKEKSNVKTKWSDALWPGESPQSSFRRWYLCHLGNWRQYSGFFPPLAWCTMSLWGTSYGEVSERWIL